MKTDSSNNITDVDYYIIIELYKAIKLLGGKSDILGTVGSWKQELPDEDVLAGLKAWNEAAEKELKERLY